MRDFFNNHDSAFAHRSTKELKQLVRLFRLLSNPRISKLGIQLLKRFGHIKLPGVQTFSTLGFSSVLCRDIPTSMRIYGCFAFQLRGVFLSQLCH